LIEFGSFFRIVELIEGNPKPFAIMYSFGNIISICSSFFLAGPYTQLKKMFAPTRAIATIIYLTVSSHLIFLLVETFFRASLLHFFVLSIKKFQPEQL